MLSWLKTSLCMTQANEEPNFAVRQRINLIPLTPREEDECRSLPLKLLYPILNIGPSWKLNVDDYKYLTWSQIRIMKENPDMCSYVEDLDVMITFLRIYNKEMSEINESLPRVFSHVPQFLEHAECASTNLGRICFEPNEATNEKFDRSIEHISSMFRIIKDNKIIPSRCIDYHEKLKVSEYVIGRTFCKILITASCIFHVLVIENAGYHLKLDDNMNSYCRHQRHVLARTHHISIIASIPVLNVIVLYSLSFFGRRCLNLI